jgi:hypothetical protein
LDVFVATESNRIGAPEAAHNLHYNSYRYAAKLRGLSFNLSAAEFLELTKQDCFYCGEPPKTNRAYYDRQRRKALKRENKFDDTYYSGGLIKVNGVDRMDSMLGYFLDNCVPCCSLCNITKRELGINEYFSLVEKIYNRHIRTQK